MRTCWYTAAASRAAAGVELPPSRCGRRSAGAAAPKARAYLGELEPDNRFLETAALHVHVPEGATPLTSSEALVAAPLRVEIEGLGGAPIAVASAAGGSAAGAAGGAARAGARVSVSKTDFSFL